MRNTTGQGGGRMRKVWCPRIKGLKPECEIHGWAESRDLIMGNIKSRRQVTSRDRSDA